MASRSKNRSLFVSFWLAGISIGFLAGLSTSPFASTLLSGLLSIVTTLLVSVQGLGIKRAQTATDEGSEDESRPKNLYSIKSSTASLASASVGLLIGVCGGIYVRAHDGFGNDPGAVSEKWAKVTGASKERIAEVLFEREFGYDLSVQEDLKTKEALADLTKKLQTLTENQAGKPGSQKDSDQIKKIQEGLEKLNTRISAAIENKKNAPKPNEEREKAKSSVFFSTLISADDCRNYASTPDAELADKIIYGDNENLRNFALKCEDPKILRILLQEVACKK